LPAIAKIIARASSGLLRTRCEIAMTVVCLHY